jgi:hypothetical protein
VLFLIVYGGNEFHWASKKKNLDWAINMYLDKSKELDHARGAFIGGMGKAGMGGIRPEAKLTRADKIIWASKLKTLATAVPERIWISNLVIKGSPPSLNLFCHVYSNGKDHLKDIALFIKDLKSQKVFFQDFKEVKFHSARRSKKNKDIYDFTLLFLLNREMIEEKKETVAKAKVS